MRSKLHYFDLAICLIWILSAFCGRYYWNQTTTVFLGMVVLLRISLSFTLMREEKKAAQFKLNVASPRGANQKMVQHDTG